MGDMRGGTGAVVTLIKLFHCDCQPGGQTRSCCSKWSSYCVYYRELPVIKIKGINSEIQLEREIKCLQKCLQTTKLETFAMFALSVV